MLLRISLYLILIPILTDWYIYARFVKPSARRKSLRLLYWAPTLLLMLMLAALTLSEDFSDSHMRLIGLYIIIYMAIVIPKGLFCLLALAGQLLSRVWKPFHATGVAAGITVGLLSMYIVLYGTFEGWKRYEVTEVTYTSPDLPEAFDGYRITQFSDLHIGTIADHPQQVQQLVDKINAQQSDLIVFTGDLVNHRASELDGVEHILGRLRAADGVYSVLGNHDFSPYVQWPTPEAQSENLQDLIRRKQQMGWQVLNNAHTLLHRGDTCIALIGVQNEGYRPMLRKGDLPKAMQGTEDYFKILLSHDPTHWRREVVNTDINLMLAGHTHSMQFKLFGFTPSSWFFKENAGMYEENGRSLYVNTGVGEVMLPFRFGAWPEITVLTLRKK